MKGHRRNPKRAKKRSKTTRKKTMRKNPRRNRKGQFVKRSKIRKNPSRRRRVRRARRAAAAPKRVLRKAVRRRRKRNPTYAQVLAIRRARHAGRGPNLVAYGPAHDPGLAGKVYVKGKGGKKGYFRNLPKKSKGKSSRKSKGKSPRRKSSRIGQHRKKTHSAVTTALARVNRSLAALKGKTKGKSPKARRARAFQRAYRARKAALRVARSRRRYGVSDKFARASRAYGLTRANFSLKGALKDLGGLMLPGAVAAGAAVGAWVAGKKAMDMLPDVIKTKIPEAAKPYIPAVGVGLAGAAAFVLLQYLGTKNAKLARLAAPAYFGAMASAGLALISAVQVKDAAGAPLSLSKKLGLPIGEFVGVSGYVEMPGGQMVAVNGLGEFVGVSGQLTLPNGQTVAVNGVGEFVHDEVGLSGMGSIFSNSTLGLIPNQSAAQVPMGREPSHGLSEEVTAEDVLDLAEGGTLSGDIFDE